MSIPFALVAVTATSARLSGLVYSKESSELHDIESRVWSKEKSAEANREAAQLTQAWMLVP